MTKKQNTLLQLTLLVPCEHSEDVQELLSTLSNSTPAVFSRPGLKIDRVVAYLQPDSDVTSIMEQLKAIYTFAFRERTEIIYEDDWMNKWKEDYHPFKLTKSIKVLPSWIERKQKSKNLIEIILDPGYAFGTGLHDTTQFMARMLEREEKRSTSFLDIGSGSGILSIVAAKLGYIHIVSIDKDPNAFEAAEENAAKNDVANEIIFLHSCIDDFNSDEKFDFVGANLNSSLLLEHSAKILSFMHEDSYVAISGIGVENRREVHKHFKSYGLRCIKKFIGAEWCGYLYKKASNTRIPKTRKRIERTKARILKTTERIRSFKSNLRKKIL